jgi:hypothetical protein
MLNILNILNRTIHLYYIQIKFYLIIDHLFLSIIVNLIYFTIIFICFITDIAIKHGCQKIYCVLYYLFVKLIFFNFFYLQ